jgi:hypothetical protein
MVRRIPVSLGKYLFLFLVFAAITLPLVPDATAQANMNLTSGGSYVMNGIYVGPYSGTANGQPIQIICDDFSDDSYLNESWTASVTDLSNVGSSTTPMWLGYSNASTLYADAAWLATQMFVPANENTTTEGYLAYAIWSLFNPNALTGLSTGQLNGVNGWLGEIPQGLTPGNFPNFVIYTPDTSLPITCNGGPCPTSPPQEFLTKVPEGGSGLAYLVLAATMCFGGIILRFRSAVIPSALRDSSTGN